MSVETIRLTVNKTIETDILVAGGGTAGCCAAIAAAREGAKVLLAEQWGTLGGSATLNLVSPVGSIRSKGGRLSFGGLAEAIFAQVEKLARQYAGADSSAISSPHILKYVLLDMVTKAGVKLLLHTRLVAADNDYGRITKIYLHTKSGVIAVKAKYFIDTSGDADLAALAGAECRIGAEADAYDRLAELGLNHIHKEDATLRNYQPPAGQSGMQPASSMFILGGVEEDKGKPYINKRLTYADLGITKAEFLQNFYAGTPGWEDNNDLVPLPQGRVLFFPSNRNGEVVVNMSRVIGVDPTDADSYTRGEVVAQKQVLAITDFLKRYIRGFENCYLIDSSSVLGIRESRRMVGPYVLTGADVILCRKFSDVIAHGSYIIDIHDPYGKQKAIGGSIRGEYYAIPYRCLYSVTHANLAAAGRCLSADHVAHSSSRVQGTCMLTGEAVGMAAALATVQGKDFQAIDVSELQQMLINHRVFLDREQ